MAIRLLLSKKYEIFGGEQLFIAKFNVKVGSDFPIKSVRKAGW